MMIILTNTYFQYLRPGDNLLYCPIKSEEVENMIDLKEKNVLCTTKNEAAAILKEAEKQGIRWYDGDLATAYNPLIEHDGPIVLTFKYNGINWIGASATDTARDLLDTDREMTAHEFLNKFLDMAYHCSNCEECKTIKVDGCDYRWCDSDLWTKDNIVLVSEQSAPEDFKCIWEQEVSRSIKATDKSKSTEKLFIYNCEDSYLKTK